MLLRHHEVLATPAGGGLTARRIRSGGVAQAGAVFLAVDTKSPVAHAEHEAGVHQQPGVALEVLFEPGPPKVRAFGHDLGAGAPAQAVRPAINGRWLADVRYGWMTSDLRETLDLQGEGTALQGTASFLRVPRGIEEGRVDADGIRFTTRSTEVAGRGRAQVAHRAKGWAKWLMQVSHKGACGQLRHTAQRLGSHRQTPPGRCRANGEAIPLNNLDHI